MAKTKGVKNCTAGNKKCGARCIPQTWDCRLKGEGANKELAATKNLDPLATLAQIQRGGTRIIKGVGKGNFSEIEGGRRQLIRTAARNTKGEGGRELTLKEKKEITDRLITGTAIVGTALAVLAGGATAHKILMRAPTYRSRIGNSINNSLNDAQNKLLDSIPLSGNRRGVNATAARASGQRAVSLTTPDLKSNRAEVLGGAAQPPSGRDSDVVRQMNKVQIDTSRPATQVEVDSLKAYLGAKRKVGGDADNPIYLNAHAEASALQTISRAYGIDIPKTGRSVDIKKSVLAGMQTRIEAEQFAVRSDLKQRGYILSNPESKQQYIDAIFGGDPLKEAHARQLLGGKQPSSIAKGIYDSQVSGWGSFYDSMAESIGDDLGRLSRGKALLADQNDIIQIARVKHAEFLDRTMSGSPGGRINRLNGASTQSSVMKLTAVEYHARKNGSRTEWTAPKALVRSAAQELGISTENMNDAFMELSKKFQGLRGEVIFPTGVTRQAREAVTAGFGFTDQEAILKIYQSLRKERSTRVSSVEIMRQAIAKHEANKKRRDSERNDFTALGDRQGKPCGKSFIPKSQKCAKPTTARYAQKPNVPNKKGTGKGESKTASTLAKAGLAVGGLALGAVAAKRGLRSGVNRIKKSKSSKWYVKNAQKTIGEVEKRKGFYDKLKTPKAKAKYVGTSIQRSIRETRSQMAALGSHATIRALSNENVNKGLARLPREYQDSALKLVGNAKKGAAEMSLNASGFKPVEIDVDRNFTRWRGRDGSMKSLGSVGDTLVSFNVGRTRGKGRSVDIDDRSTYNVDFLIDNSFNQKKNITSDEGTEIAGMIKQMFSSNTKDIKDGSILFNSPWQEDAKGAARNAVYKR